MFSFRIFGYPVHVQWMFWLLCILLGMGYLDDADSRRGLGRFLIMAGVFFVSILWHELGHAFARKKFGAQYSEITIHGLGGYCSGPGSFTRNESVLISAAGPIANFVLVGLAWFLAQTPGMDNFWVRHFVLLLFWVNALLGLFNLLPILPLDGGRIFEAIAGPGKIRIVLWTSIILATVIAVGGLMRGDLWILVIMGYIAYTNWQRLQGTPTSF